MVVRWDPKSRAGAVGIRVRGALDVKAVEAVAATVDDWADYQNLAGEPDNVETSPVQGTYDWRAYLQEETELARKREAKTVKKQPSRAPAPPAAPHVFYA